MSLSFGHSTKLISVPQADAQPLTMQALINAIRTEEASERGITEPQIASAAGKDDLGGGVYTGITVNLASTWKLNFSAGAYQATVSGGNLSDALARINNTGSPQVLVQASAAATAVSTSGSTPPTAAAIAAETVNQLNATTIPVDMQKTNGVEIVGDGTSGDKFRSVLYVG